MGGAGGIRVDRRPSSHGVVLLAALALMAIVVSPAAAMVPQGQPGQTFPGAAGRIAFATSRDVADPSACGQTCDFEIYSMNPDGSGVTRLTNHPARDRDPSWSPADDRIAFVSNRDGDMEIFTMNAGGSGLVQLTNNAVDDYNPVWSPDGTKIGFMQDAGNMGPCFQECVLTMNSDGTDQAFISGAFLSFDLTWSPDGSRLAYGKYFYGLYTANPDGTGKVLVLDRSGDEQILAASPSWSPRGAPILTWTEYYGPGGGDFALIAVNPDATWFDFSAARSSLDVYQPEWKPGGDQVAFASELSGSGLEFNLFKLNADGSNLLQLTNIGNNLANVWSPDGAQIAFVSDRDDPQSNCGSHGSYATCNAEIYVMNPDGTAQTNITNTPSVDTDPDWQPLRAFDRYPRPGGGTPLQVWFVPAYAPCTSPNTTHAPPLALGSCTPPGRESTLLTTGTIGQQKASVRLDALLGNPGTPADEADIALTSSLRDVRTAAGTDYTGEVLLSTKMRTTDRASGAGVSATMSDFRFDLPLGCTSTPEPSLGSSCSLTTTFDALLAGLAKEGKRSVIATDSFMVMDAGLDGDVSAPSCPPACGTGDEETYLVQGTFLP